MFLLEIIRVLETHILRMRVYPRSRPKRLMSARPCKRKTRIMKRSVRTHVRVHKVLFVIPLRCHAKTAHALTLVI